MTTIAIKESTRRELIRIAGEIQRRTRERVDFDTVIRFLIEAYEKDKINLNAWQRFLEPIPGADFESLYLELMAERRSDER